MDTLAPLRYKEATVLTDEGKSLVVELVTAKSHAAKPETYRGLFSRIERAALDAMTHGCGHVAITLRTKDRQGWPNIEVELPLTYFAHRVSVG